MLSHSQKIEYSKQEIKKLFSDNNIKSIKDLPIEFELTNYEVEFELSKGICVSIELAIDNLWNSNHRVSCFDGKIIMQVAVSENYDYESQEITHKIIEKFIKNKSFTHFSIMQVMNENVTFKMQGQGTVREVEMKIIWK